ncbi:hypothetical protein QPK87_01185 [Kamptonema cortianum]|nr:hypothetical protein [Geitlerinema splendidum]MDK3155202.1 hypothetical protein [Kamptonema cortianum]
MAIESSSESWKKMVLRSMPPPAWLEPDAPDGDVVVSTRHRFARNLCSFRFPHHASNEELRLIQQQVQSAAKVSPVPLEPMGRLTEAERDYLLGSRLISADFSHREVGRSVLLDRSRMVSVMVNEEDHLRIQAVTGGWSAWTAEETCRNIHDHLARHLSFAKTHEYGYITACPTNLGVAERRSALFHLIGLATQGKLPRMLRSLHLMGFVPRGLFGEASRGVAAFIQVSSTTSGQEDFRGACAQLIREERMARRETQRSEITDRALPAIEFAIASKEISLRDALLVLGWVRWAAAVELPGFKTKAREVDAWTAQMEVFGTQEASVAARHRADFLRVRLENLS